MLIHTLLYRLTDGKLGGKMGGGPILLLSVLGRRTNKLYVAPLMYIPYGTAYVVIASARGAPKHPAWALNLRTNPRAIIQIEDATINVEASEAAGPEREELWARLLDVAPFLAQHQEKTQRTIPIVVLRPV
jgi:deazaflavin-dependent oxidoreductase (nitroreductase family)